MKIKAISSIIIATMANVKRKILFYKVQPEGLLLTPYLQELGALDGDNIYTDYFDENKRVYVDVISTDADQIKAKISYYRSTDFPRVARNGTRESYDLNLQPDEGLADTSHLIYFPTSGVIAIEFNFNAPRVTALAYHLKAKTAVPPELSLAPITRPSVMEELDRLRTIKSVSVSAYRGSIEEVQHFDKNIYESLNNASKLGGTESVEIVIQAGRKRESRLALSVDALKDKLGIFSKNDSDPAYVFKRLRITGEDERTEKIAEVDLLQQIMVSQVSVPKIGHGRDIVSDSMFEQINVAYSDNQRLLTTRVHD